MKSDIGESIVGSYLRHVRGCEMVLHNSFTGENQGEIDVVGIRLTGGDPTVWLCEVATHIRGLQYDASAAKSRAKLSAKIDRAKAYADKAFPDHQQHIEVWSPYVPKGAMTIWMDKERTRRSKSSVDVDFVINERYAEALNDLIRAAAGNTSTTGEDAFRMLQILTHVRGTLEW